MIPFNLKEEKHKNHPLDGKYGMVVTNTPYAKYPVTIVDNSQETEKGRYTGKPALCLLHLSEDVRTYTNLKLFDEFLYVSFAFSKPTYRMYDYAYEELSDEKIIQILRHHFYAVQPMLQGRSLVGSSSKRIEDDPNYYEGYYVLNDEQDYTILKCGTKYKFYRGTKKYYPNWSKDEDLIYEGNINFDVYKIALEVQRLRSYIVTNTNYLLDTEDDDSIAQYKELKCQLKEMMEQESKNNNL